MDAISSSVSLFYLPKQQPKRRKFMNQEALKDPGDLAGKSEMEPQEEITPEADPAPEIEGQSSEVNEAATDPAPTDDGQPVDDVESFYDVRDIQDKPELMSIYKQMQGAFTTKTQDIAANKKKIDMVDAFNANPEAAIRQLAQQHGINLAGQQADPDQGEGEPQTWGEVYDRAKQEVLRELAPQLNEIRTMKQNSIEKQFDKIDPGWRQYESEMTDTLRRHPSLANDPTALYRLSVPPDIVEARAAKKVLAKMEQKTQSSSVSKATVKPKTMAVTDKPMTVGEAAELAKQQLAERGIGPV